MWGWAERNILNIALCSVTGFARRSKQRAEALAADAGPGVSCCSLEDVRSEAVKGDVLANTTSIGMQPDVDASPLPAAALSGFQLAFDAIYTPVQTRLLKVSAYRS